ncbi:MAG: hypothetical protein JXB45_00375 [Candidatus Krumholzibacteriota bacterium]|nr:hypothetical protein [Candidatus Krumholzibacteriota bacterium]
MEKRLNALRAKESKTIVGIETGNTLGSLGAVIVEVRGAGDSTLLDLHSFYSHTVPDELGSALKALGKNNKLDSEESAGINFLLLHHITALFQKLLEQSDISPEDIDLIGLKCLEFGKETFPADPSVLCETTNCIVVSRFSIVMDDENGTLLPVRESILQGMVEEMIEKFGLESEAREAVGVALLANESLYHESLVSLKDAANPASGTGPATSRSIKSKGAPMGKEKARLYGEFFFPA